MKKRVLLIVAVMLLTTAVTSVAGAAPPSCDDNPNNPNCIPTTPTPTSSTTTTTTTQAPPDFWTCQARVDNGAMWNLGEWNGTAYVAGISSCTDILAEHLGVNDWTVEWTGISAKGTVKGLEFVFEEEVHNNVFAEQEFTRESGSWCPSFDEDVDNLVFVAMRHNADRWTSFEVTVTPGHIPDVCEPSL